MLSARLPKCFSPYFRTISDSLAFCLSVPMCLSDSLKLGDVTPLSVKIFLGKGVSKIYMNIYLNNANLCSTIKSQIFYIMSDVRIITFFKCNYNKMMFVFRDSGSNISSEFFHDQGFLLQNHVLWALCRILYYI